LALLSEALDVVAAEPEIHALFFIVSSLGARAVEIADVISGYWARAPKPVCVNWVDAPKGAPDRLAAKGIYAFPEHARGARALRRLVRYQADRSRPLHPARVDLPAFDWSAFVQEPGSGTVFPEHQCHRILQAAGLSVAAGQVASSEEDAVGAAEAVGLPVALKGLSPTVTHRAAAGLLAVDLRTADEVRVSYRRLVARARELKVALDGIYVQRLVAGGLELLVSAFRDPLFGTMLTCGAGGNLTELLDDVVVERAPVDEALVLHLLGQLRIVRQARPDPGRDPRSAARFITEFSRLAATAPWRRFVLEVNPIKWSREGAVAVDGLLIVEEP
jgi:acetyltransferase